MNEETNVEKKELLGDDYEVFDRISATQSVFSLDYELKADDGSELDVLVPSVDDTEVEAFKSILKQDIFEALDVLGKREREIIELCFGMTGDKVFTLDQIAERYGVTGERIRQIKVKALGKLYDSMTQQSTLD